INLAALAAFVGEYFAEQLLTAHVFGSGSVLVSPLIISLAAAGLIAWLRALAEKCMFEPPSTLATGAVEWVLIVVASYIVTCLLDVLRHPPESFVTVAGFNLFLVLLPSLVVSTSVYM